MVSPKGESGGGRSRGPGRGGGLHFRLFVTHCVVMARPEHTDLAAQRARRLRNSLTISEARLWPHLKNRATGARFRRQVPIGKWIVDFASLQPKIVIEADDSSHIWRDETARTKYLEAHGFVVLRFSNREIAQELDGVLEMIEQTVGDLK